MEKIAIIGFSCLFPDAKNPDVFWQNLMAGKDSTTSATPTEFGVDPSIFYGPGKGDPDQTYSLQGGYTRDFKFDPNGYSLSPEQLTSLDAIAQSSVYVAKQALQHSGYWNPAPQHPNCGLILGNLSLPTRLSNQLFSPMYQQVVETAVKALIHYPDFQLKSLGSDLAVAPANALTSSLPTSAVAQALALAGPTFAFDAACASSLYAVKLAGQYLLSHQADLMLAGAVSYADALFVRMLFSGLQAYPDNGISRPFDRQSRGLTPADGAGMVVLKRYSEAVRDGDTVYGVVAGVGLSNDGRGKHLLSPNHKGQVLAFERAYAEANLTPRSIDYLECHATGTLVGDSTELNSIDHFFGRWQARPQVGAVKANTGHLLTAAGMVSLIKVLLSMNQGTIPPTINLQEPATSTGGVITPDRMVTQPTPWPQTDHPRRAAINAFGFGGTNAHLILEHPTAITPIAANSAAEPVPLVPMAITGMAAHFGGCEQLDAFDRSLYDGVQQFRPLPRERWRGVETDQALLQTYGWKDNEAPNGAYIDAFDINPLQFKIPPSEIHKLHPQQLLILKVADQALRDAALQEGSNVAVIVAMEMDPSIHQLQQRWNFSWQVEQGLAATGANLDPDTVAALQNILKDSFHTPAQTSEFVGYIGNIMSSRIAALWDFNGPAFTLSAGDNSAIKALEAAQILLSHNEVDAVLVGAVDLAGNFESILLNHQAAPINTGSATTSHDQKANGWMVGEGAGAVVLKRVDVTQQAKERIYATIDAMSLRPNLCPETSIPSAAAIAQVCQQAYQTAQVRPHHIGYLELSSLGTPQADATEIEGLAQVFADSQTKLSCAVGSVTANIGYTQVAHGLASLIKTALCLYHRYIPSVPRWSAPKQPDLWRHTPFYVAQESRAWLLGANISKRVAAINHLGRDGTVAHLILSEPVAQPVRPSRYLEQTPFYLFVIAGRDRITLHEKLTVLQQTLEAADSMAAAACQSFNQYQQDGQLPYTLALVGNDKQALLRDLERAFTGIDQAFATGAPWQTPSGSYFTATPQGAQGQVAFVYPGAFNAYVGQGRDYFRLFPDIFNHPILQMSNNRMAKLDPLLYPRSLKALSRRQLEVLDQRLLADPIAMFEAEMGCAGFTTTILQDYFQLWPRYALGYSLGETSMMLAQGVFANTDFSEGSHALSQSPLFRDRISGPQNSVREFWGLPPASTHNEPPFWSNYVLMATPEAVNQALQHQNRVFLTQINTPNEVVIAGAPQACKAVVATLGCNAFEAPFNHVIHCPAMASEYEAFVKINTLAIQQTPNVKFYSAAAEQCLVLDSQMVGQTIARNLCQQLDFPRLVNRVYDDGARIFVEVGAGGTCSRWISEILSSRPHLTTLLNRRGMDDHSAVVRALARLVSHRVPLDLSPLYSRRTETAGRSCRAMTTAIPLGGPSIPETLLSAQNKDRFNAVQVQVRQPHLPQTQPQPIAQAAAVSQPTTVIYPISPSTLMSPTFSANPHPQSMSEPSLLVPETAPASSQMELSPMFDPNLPQMQQLRSTNEAVTQAHATFLSSRQEALRHFQQIIEIQMALAATTLETHNDEC